MRKYFFIFMLGMMLIPMGVGAAVISFTDDIIYMPTWESSDHSDNYTDNLGTPEFTGGQVNVEGNTITNVTFDYRYQTCPMGDLFVDKDNNGYFDYVLNTSSGNIITFDDQVLSSKKGMNDDLYQMSYAAINGDYRNDHFVALNLEAVYALVSSGQADILGQFNGREQQNGYNDYSYVFDGFTSDLTIDGIFNLSFTPLCANDVVSATVPLPGTFALLAGGVFGLAGLRRKIQGR